MATSEEEQQQFEYDVFLSYNRRERDARIFFPQHLHDVLTQKGIKSYKYGEDLEEGEVMAPAVDEAMKNSRVAVIIFSRQYASSASCLSELGTILEQNNLIGKRVMPLFYGVEPSWIRRQRESYQEAMADHESRYGRGSEKVRQWREALTEVADLRGWILAGNREGVNSVGVPLCCRLAPLETLRFSLAATALSSFISSLSLSLHLQRKMEDAGGGGSGSGPTSASRLRGPLKCKRGNSSSSHSLFKSQRGNHLLPRGERLATIPPGG
ncbi:hypothetical protein BT93_J0772 [Corymbia citriodora subsp. variegata]|nr:hypothetical protein BT93_J0772 [Corymbia citriodora subsp. variegata]